MTIYPIRPSAPEQLPAIQPPIFPVEDSIISFPVRADLTALLDAVNDEQVIPKRFDHWGSYSQGLKGVEYKYYAERDEFSINAAASGFSARGETGPVLRDWWKGIERSADIFVSAGLRYKIRANPQTIPFGVPAQCGDGDEWPRMATLNGNIAIDMTPDFGLTASVTGVTVNPIDSCKIGMAELDVAKEVRHVLADSAGEGLRDAVARLNTITFKSHVENIWSVLRNPIQLEPGAWLLFNIVGIRHGGFLSAGPIIENTIQMVAKPVIVFGDEPPSASAALPQLDARPAPTGFRIVTDVQLDYAALSEALADRLRGERVSNGDQTIIIADASMYGNGGNQVVIRIDFKGDAHGHAYFVGKPRLNTLTQAVYFDSLRYDFATAQLLRKDAEWLYRSTFREFIATEAILGVTSATNSVRNMLAPALNRRLSPEISLRGNMASVQGVGVFAEANALHILVMAEGALNVTVSSGA